MYDPDLHLFVTDDEIFAIRHLKPMVQIWRKDDIRPVLLPEGREEGTALGYASVIHDREEGLLKIWYTPHSDGLIRTSTPAIIVRWTGETQDGRTGTVRPLIINIPDTRCSPCAARRVTTGTGSGII